MKNVYPATCTCKDKYKETNKIKANMHVILYTIALLWPGMRALYG